MKILGISCWYHDSAAALIDDGRVVAAAQEERFTRKKHDQAFPTESIRYCLSTQNLKVSELDAIAFYEKPFIKFERLVETYLAFAPKGFTSFRKSMPIWFQEKLFQKSRLRKALTALDPAFRDETKILFSEHHLSHAASAFFSSPFQEAAVLTMDGVGEWTTTSVAVGDGNELTIKKEIHFPHSVGLLYSALTYFLGFKVNSGEYKVMGLAPYGTPKYVDIFYKHIIDLKDDGSLRLNLDLFDYCTGLRMTNDRFDKVMGIPRRLPEQELTDVHMDIAASLQAVTEEVVLRLARSTVKETGKRNLCLAGGVALNCVANGKIVKAGIVDNLWIQPAAGDAGGALGAALATYHLHFKQPRALPADGKDGMHGAYLGPAYSTGEVSDRLTALGAKFQRVRPEEVVPLCVSALKEGKALGWFQSRMEFGPRALGARSIIADARNPTMQAALNLKIKYRESFRPFAPIVTRERLSQWFDLDVDSPYMLLVAPVKEERRRSMTDGELAYFGIKKLNVVRSEIPAVTHVDYSARIQTVHAETNPRLHDLLNEFEKATACPVLVNTSFNVRGEPIVNTPEEAFRCFMGTELDVLAIEDCLVYKPEQNPALKEDYKDKFDLD